MSRLDRTTAIVTGASSGIGAATARLLAAEGARVIGGARRVERLETDVALELDVTDPASCERFVEQAGPADILVNAAGLALGREPFSESTEEDERTVFETNVNGLVRMTRLVLPHIRDMLFDHSTGRGSGAGYDHHDYIPEMRAALEHWATYVEGLVTAKRVKLLR